MGLFSSFRVAPGVRISTSSRGLRAHVGPRLARLHVGGGGTGVSTGAGPFTLYESVDPPSARRAPSQGAVTRANELTPAQAERARQVAEVEQAWERLRGQHRLSFSPAERPGPVVPEPVPMFSALFIAAERDELRGVKRFDREARREARGRARELAEAEALRLLTAKIQDQESRQRFADASWEALVAGERKAVSDAVRRRLADRGARATVEVHEKGTISVTMQVPGPAALPTHKPSVTPKGMPTLKKLNKTEVAEEVREVVASRVLLAAKEALAQSPAMREVVVVAHFEGARPMLKSTLTRAALDRVDWDPDAWSVLTAVDPDIEVNLGGRTQELRPLAR